MLSNQENKYTVHSLRKKRCSTEWVDGKRKASRFFFFLYFCLNISEHCYWHCIYKRISILFCVTLICIIVLHSPISFHCIAHIDIYMRWLWFLFLDHFFLKIFLNPWTVRFEEHVYSLCQVRSTSVLLIYHFVLILWIIYGFRDRVTTFLDRNVLPGSTKYVLLLNILCVMCVCFIYTHIYLLASLFPLIHPLCTTAFCLYFLDLRAFSDFLFCHLYLDVVQGLCSVSILCFFFCKTQLGCWLQLN